MSPPAGWLQFFLDWGHPLLKNLAAIIGFALVAGRTLD